MRLSALPLVSNFFHISRVGLCNARSLKLHYVDRMFGRNVPPYRSLLRRDKFSVVTENHARSVAHFEGDLCDVLALRKTVCRE